MEPVKVLVKPVKNPSGMVCLAPIKDVEISENLILEKDVAFFNVTPLTFKEMKKPKSVTVILRTGDMFIEPDI